MAASRRDHDDNTSDLDVAEDDDNAQGREKVIFPQVKFIHSHSQISFSFISHHFTVQ